MVYNSKLIAAADVPKTLNELSASKWQRKLVLNAQGSPFNTLGIVLGREAILEMTRKVKANRPLLKPGAPQVVAAVAPEFVLERERAGWSCPSACWGSLEHCACSLPTWRGSGLAGPAYPQST